jgi:aminoglycoside/choline kinase family phosphotransferase
MRPPLAVATMRAMTENASTGAPSPTNGQPDARAIAGLAWARTQLERPGLQLEPLAGDASFRRYFRLRDGGDEWVLMDAPPDREDSAPFVDVARRLQAASVPVPTIEAADLSLGYLLLEDLGDTLLRAVLTTDSVDEWFPALFDMLATLAQDVGTDGLPAYDRPRLRDELELFTEWYLGRHKGLLLDCGQLDLWEDLATRLMVSAERQPQVFVHRDFHSCNLLVRGNGALAVIDFQDAVRGPLSYDLASLLWDRYITWPRPRLVAWIESFRRAAAPELDPDDWLRAVDWMGLQRNLKIVGIFARLHYRDGKAGYLDMIPRFWAYVRDTLRRYPEFADFDALLEELQCAP